jgi:hypothetical protein
MIGQRSLPRNRLEWHRKPGAIGSQIDAISVDPGWHAAWSPEAGQKPETDSRRKPDLAKIGR